MKRLRGSPHSVRLLHSISHGRNGAALLTVMVVMITTSLALSAMMSASLFRIAITKRITDRHRAMAIAEAGVNVAYSVLRTNFVAREDPEIFMLTPYSGGSFDVDVTPVGSDMAVISSVGKYNDSRAHVVVDIRDYGGDEGAEPGPGSGDWGGSAAFDYAMICDGTLDFKGCGSIDGTNDTVKMHCNGEMDVGGNAQADVSLSSSTEINVKNVIVDGDVTAPILSIHGGADITGTASEEFVDLVAIPDIDLTPFYNWANSHGEVHNGFSMSGGEYTPDGGVIWVNGDVQLSSDYKFNGTIIATGEIHASGQGDVIASEYGFVLVSRDSNISNQSSGTIRGLIYCKTGSYDHTANGRVEGQIIVAGDIKKAGNSDVLLFDRITPTYPDDDGTGAQPTPPGSQIGVSAWQK